MVHLVGGAAVSTQTVPPFDIPTAVANPALADSQAIMVNVGELRRMVREAGQGIVLPAGGWSYYVHNPCTPGTPPDRVRYSLSRFAPDPDCRAEYSGLTADELAAEVRRTPAQAQRPIEDAIAAELELGA